MHVHGPVMIDNPACNYNEFNLILKYTSNVYIDTYSYTMHGLIYNTMCYYTYYKIGHRNVSEFHVKPSSHGRNFKPTVVSIYCASCYAVRFKPNPAY